MVKRTLLQRKGVLIICMIFLQLFTLKYSPKIIAQSSSTEIDDSVVIKDEQLKKFTVAIKSLQIIDKTTQLEILKVMEKMEMSPEEFMKIEQQEKNKLSPNIEKQTKFEETLNIIKKINEEDRLKKREAIKNAGLEVSQFNEIGKLVESDPELQKIVVRLLGT